MGLRIDQVLGKVSDSVAKVSRMTSTAHVQVTYDGDIIRGDHMMDTRDFGSSLVSLADAYGRAAQLVVGEQQEKPRVEISATREGSFEVALVLIEPGWAEALTGPLLSEPAQAIANATALTTIVANALSFIRRIRGRSYRSRDTGTPGVQEVTITGENSTVVFDQRVIQVAEDSRFRRDARGFIAPVTAGIESSVRLTTGIPDDDPVEITSADAGAFDESDGPDDEIDVHIHRTKLTVISAVFQGRGSWKFDSVTGPLSARIEDPEFIRRIDAGEQFGKGTVLDCDLEVTHNITRDKITRRIINVHGKETPADQPDLFGGDN